MVGKSLIFENQEFETIPFGEDYFLLALKPLGFMAVNLKKVLYFYIFRKEPAISRLG